MDRIKTQDFLNLLVYEIATVYGMNESNFTINATVPTVEIYDPTTTSAPNNAEKGEDAIDEEVFCAKANEESDYFASVWLEFECIVEENPIMFWFSTVSSIVFTGIVVGSILGYNQKTTGRMCCKICRCGSTPDCAYCCVEKIKCPQPICSKCTCCIDELDGENHDDDGDDGDLESVNPGNKDKSNSSRTKIVPMSKKIKKEQRATAIITKEKSASIFDFEDFLEEKEDLEDEEEDEDLEDQIEEDLDEEYMEDEEDEDVEEDEDEE